MIHARAKHFKNLEAKLRKASTLSEITESEDEINESSSE